MTSFPPSWCLMRLAMVQLVLINLKSFYPMAGYDLLGKLELHNTPIQCANILQGDKTLLSSSLSVLVNLVASLFVCACFFLRQICLWLPLCVMLC